MSPGWYKRNHTWLLFSSEGQVRARVYRLGSLWRWEVGEDQGIEEGWNAALERVCRLR